MTFNGWLQIVVYVALLLLLVRPLGGFMHRLYVGERVWLTPLLGPVERGMLRLAGIDGREQQHWSAYAAAMLLFNLGGFVLLYGILRTQAWLPLNPQHLPNLAPALAFNTAISFVTNTNWQAYGGESTMSDLAQMGGLAVQNFLSAATGIALAFALIRGFACRGTTTVGNFWVDLTRVTLYVLLPICLLYALLLIALGVPQNFSDYTPVTTLEGARQLIAQGPVASQEAIKMLGTNGGGFFNANSAHPFENPSALSNLLQMLSIFAIGAALTDVFGRAVGNRRQGHAILGAMLLLFVVGAGLTYWAESAAPSALTHVTALQASGNLEGKETRFGIAASSLYAVITTAASCGAVDAMHDSFTALGGAVPLLNIMLGEVIVGGVGAGFYGMMLYALIAIFMAGLMVGRTPEYLGKKIETREIKLAMLAVLVAPLMILGFTALACVVPAGLAGRLNDGAHGFSEMLYAYSSAAGNNGSAFAGLSADSTFYDVTLAIAMLVGRFAIIVPMLAIAGALAAKRAVPPSAGTLPSDGGLFVALLIAVVLVFGGLTFLPSLVLGPVAEHTAMLTGGQP
ncbi:potassium-transporting ATPase subunit KdpA [Solimonas marina]|uniref:Potassium-transporting ATPase potassium-binding subunit n=1 Tax=Solimonas marina TaxID=2714601 RepID=A0A969WC72_9GAMM|nr:potassium-transporting ATPase subunit KdpA [Solimonas marina]NKF24686.1 potassium-transporting ATPase subunit KdpA [Solimonas marina]